MKFFKKLGLKAKAILIAILGVLGFILFFVIRGKIRSKEHLNYELSRLRNEIEVAHLEEKTEENLEKLEELKKQEAVIREKIKFIEEKEAEGIEDVSLEALDEFFGNLDL